MISRWVEWISSVSNFLGNIGSRRNDLIIYEVIGEHPYFLEENASLNWYVLTGLGRKSYSSPIEPYIPDENDTSCQPDDQHAH